MSAQPLKTFDTNSGTSTLIQTTRDNLEAHLTQLNLKLKVYETLLTERDRVRTALRQLDAVLNGTPAQSTVLDAPRTAPYIIRDYMLEQGNNPISIRQLADALNGLVKYPTLHSTVNRRLDMFERVGSVQGYGQKALWRVRPAFTE